MYYLLIPNNWLLFIVYTIFYPLLNFTYHHEYSKLFCKRIHFTSYGKEMKWNKITGVGYFLIRYKCAQRYTRAEEKCICFPLLWNFACAFLPLNYLLHWNPPTMIKTKYNCSTNSCFRFVFYVNLSSIRIFCRRTTIMKKSGCKGYIRFLLFSTTCHTFLELVILLECTFINSVCIIIQESFNGQ